MEKEEKEKKGMTFVCLVRKENKNKEEWKGNGFYRIHYFFSLKIALISLKGLVYFCEMTFISLLIYNLKR